MYSSLAGQEVTLGNVDTILARLRRLAILQPDQAEACATEAFLISNAMAARELPQGWTGPKVRVTEPPPRIMPSRYNCLYLALSGGRTPPNRPHNAKFAGPHGQWVFLSWDGTVRQGLTPTRSVSVPPAKIEDAIAKGKAMLAPKPEPKAAIPKGKGKARPSVATMSDLKELFK